MSNIADIRGHLSAQVAQNGNLNEDINTNPGEGFNITRFVSGKPDQLEQWRDKQVIFNTKFDYANPQKPSGRKLEVVDQIEFTNPYNQEQFGELYDHIFEWFYRDPSGGGNCPTEYLEYDRYEKMLYQDYLAQDDEADLLDFINHQKAEEVNKFILDYVRNDGRNHKRGPEDFANYQQRCIRREINLAYSRVNTMRLLQISDKFAETGHVYIGAVANSCQVITVRQALTNPRKYWHYIHKGKDLERFEARGYKIPLKDVTFIPAGKSNDQNKLFVSPIIQTAFRQFDTYQYWMAKTRNISPHLDKSIIKEHFDTIKKFNFGFCPPLTLGQATQPPVKENTNVEAEKELVAVS